MTNFDPKVLQRAVVTLLGTLILTTTAVSAAVGPAMAVETTSAGSSQSAVAGEARA